MGKYCLGCDLYRMLGPMSDVLSSYYRDVLGIETWWEPTDERKVVSGPNERRLFFVYTPFPMSAAERALVDKILSSVEVSEATFVAAHEPEGLDFRHLVQEGDSCFGISFGIRGPSEFGITWLELPSVSQFLDGADREKLQKLKREAWERLKEFKAQTQREFKFQMESR